jgi:16S rRNA (cytosine967-C5)-methyltransferase
LILNFPIANTGACNLVLQNPGRNFLFALQQCSIIMTGDHLTESDPRKIAVTVLSKLEKSHKTLDRIFKEVADSSNLPGRDRALLNALVYGVLRWRGRLDFLISQFSDKKLAQIDPIILNILRLGLFQIVYMSRIPNSAAVNTSVQLAKIWAPSWVAGFVNGTLRHAARKSDCLPVADHKNDPLQAMASEKSFPPWLIRRWMDRFEAQTTAALCDAINAVPPISIRTNTLKTSRDQLIASLETLAEGIEPSEYAPDGIRIRNLRTSISEMEAFKKGWFQVQDEAAQLVTLLLDPQPGESVLDACAGWGGKTGHIAQQMNNQGSVVALDIETEKLTQLESQMARLGVSNVTTLRRNLEDTTDEHTGQTFDRILMDAPCTGLGVLRRNPDAKWNRSKKDLKRFAQKQLKLLASVAPLLSASGIIVYAVCSIEPEENEAVINAFLSTRPGFEVDKDPGILPATFRAPIRDEIGLKTHPHFTEMDGFFMVRLKRIR